MSSRHDRNGSGKRPSHWAPRISRRSALLAGAGSVAAGALPRRAFASAGAGRGSQDLTHVFREGFPVYTRDAPVRRTLVTVEQDGFYSQEWTFGEHSGTHLDAPGHFIAGGRHSPEITLDELFVPVAVVDISDRVAQNPDAVVTPGDLKRYERRYGRIPKGAGVAAGIDQLDGGGAGARGALDRNAPSDRGHANHFTFARADSVCLALKLLSVEDGSAEELTAAEPKCVGETPDSVDAVSTDVPQQAHHVVDEASRRSASLVRTWVNTAFGTQT